MLWCLTFFIRLPLILHIKPSKYGANIYHKNHDESRCRQNLALPLKVLISHLRQMYVDWSSEFSHILWMKKGFEFEELANFFIFIIYKLDSILRALLKLFIASYKTYEKYHHLSTSIASHHRKILEKKTNLTNSMWKYLLT